MTFAVDWALNTNYLYICPLNVFFQLSATDYVNLTAVGLNTSWSFSTSMVEAGTRYYVSVRAWNMAGLQTTAVSDGVAVDPSAPTAGVVFVGLRYSHQHAQSSATSLSASWSGFEDMDSGVTSYHATVYDERDAAVPLTSFRDVGVETAYTFDLVLEHGHRFESLHISTTVLFSPFCLFVLPCLYVGRSVCLRIISIIAVVIIIINIIIIIIIIMCAERIFLYLM